MVASNHGASSSGPRKRGSASTSEAAPPARIATPPAAVAVRNPRRVIPCGRACCAVLLPEARADHGFSQSQGFSALQENVASLALHCLAASQSSFSGFLSRIVPRENHAGGCDVISLYEKNNVSVLESRCFLRLPRDFTSTIDEIAGLPNALDFTWTLLGGHIVT